MCFAVVVEAAVRRQVVDSAKDLRQLFGTALAKRKGWMVVGTVGTAGTVAVVAAIAVIAVVRAAVARNAGAAGFAV